MQCQGKVALVTGAAGSGMGRSIALTLAREGASVVVNYLTSKAAAEAIVAHIEAQGGSAIAVQADICKQDDCKRLVDTALTRYGQVDICIVGPGAGWNAEPIDQLDPANALDDLHREVAPLYYLMPLVLPSMTERHWGRIVAIGINPTKPSPALSYNASKAARAQTLLMTEKTTWKQGVTVNMVGPAPVAGIESLEKAVELCVHGSAWQERSSVTPQDIAEGVAFLCSVAGRYVTGCMLPYSF